MYNARFFEKIDCKSLYESVPDGENFSASKNPASTNKNILKNLTFEQQEDLDIFKAETIRENYIYFRQHPEIRAIIAILLQNILRRRPESDVVKFIANFFERPKSYFQKKIKKYVKEKGLVLLEESKSSTVSQDAWIQEIWPHLTLKRISSDNPEDIIGNCEEIEETLEDIQSLNVDFEDPETISKGIIDDIVTSVYEQANKKIKYKK